jgi:hypothetical protein
MTIKPAEILSEDDVAEYLPSRFTHRLCDFVLLEQRRRTSSPNSHWEKAPMKMTDTLESLPAPLHNTPKRCRKPLSR